MTAGFDAGKALAAAWNVQVAGRSNEMPDQRLDLDHFSRHEARLKAGLEF
jgi:hypothetical protein